MPALKVLQTKKSIKNRDENTKMYLIILSVISEGEMHYFHYT